MFVCDAFGSHFDSGLASLCASVQCDRFEDFVHLFLAGKVECGSWFDHTLEWYGTS